MPARSSEDEAEERADRMRWTKAAQARFVAALEQSGGVVQATPRAVLNALGMEGVSYAQVKSHLQRHRNAHIADMMDRGEDVSHLSEAQLRASQAVLEKRRAAGRRRPSSAARSPESSMQPPSQRPRSLPEVQGGGDSGSASERLAAMAAGQQLAGLARIPSDFFNLAMASAGTRSLSTGGATAGTAGNQPSSYSSEGRGQGGGEGPLALEQRAAAVGSTMMTVVLGAAPSNTATSDAVAATLNPGDLQAGPAKFDFSAAARLVQLLSRLEAMQAASELMQRQQQEIVSTLLQHSNALTELKRAMTEIQQQLMAAIAQICVEPPPQQEQQREQQQQQQQEQQQEQQQQQQQQEQQQQAGIGIGIVHRPLPLPLHTSDSSNLFASLLGHAQQAQHAAAGSLAPMQWLPAAALQAGSKDLRAKLASQAGGGHQGAFGVPAQQQRPELRPAGAVLAPQASQAMVVGATVAAGLGPVSTQQLPPAQMSDTLTLLLSAFPPSVAVAGSGGEASSDAALQMLNSVGSASGGSGGTDSLLEMLQRATR